MSHPIRHHRQLLSHHRSLFMYIGNSEKKKEQRGGDVGVIQKKFKRYTLQTLLLQYCWKERRFPCFACGFLKGSTRNPIMDSASASFTEATSRILRTLNSAAAAVIQAGENQDNVGEKSSSAGRVDNSNSWSSPYALLPLLSASFDRAISKNNNDANTNNMDVIQPSYSMPNVKSSKSGHTLLHSNSAMSLLPEPESQKLADFVRKLVKSWAAEERASGKQILDQDIMSDEAIQEVVNAVPTTIQELDQIEGIAETTINAYGERLVKVVNLFITTNELENYLHQKEHNKQIDNTGYASNKRQIEIMPSSRLELSRLQKNKLTGMVKKLVSNWAEEERVATGENIVARDIMTNVAIESIALEIPTTVENLKSIGTLTEPAIAKYGERLVKVVRSFVTTNGLEDYLQSYSADRQQQAKRQKTRSSRLPQRECQKFADLITKLVTNWAKEDMASKTVGHQRRRSSKTMIMSTASVQAIAEKVPTTVEELKRIPTLSEATIQEYGEHLVKVVQRFITTNELEGYVQGPKTSNAAVRRAWV